MLRRPLVVNLAAILAVTAFMPMPTDAQAQSRAPAQRREAPPAEAPSGPEVQAAAQAAITAAGATCQVQTANLLGSTDAGAMVYEASCATGPGYIATTGDTPSAINCLTLAESARRVLAENPEADAGAQCAMPENNNALAVIAAYAAQAGIPCQVDAGVWQGRTTSNEERYEVGCAGVDGYWLDVSPAGEITNKIDCLEVTRAGQACDFTTAEEQIATVRATVQGSNAPACDITQVASKGFNDTGRFYEVKCADAEGYIYRTDTAGAFQQAYACVDATRIVGGCTLTDVSSVVAATAEQRLSTVAGLGFSCTATQDVKIGEETAGRQREVFEYECSDLPLGVVAFLPKSGAEGAEAMDCLSLSLRGSDCRFTTEDEIKAVMTSMMSAGGVDCTVADYAGISPMEEGSGEFLEVKCSDGRGVLANFPSTRTQIQGRTISCAEAATREYECSL